MIAAKPGPSIIYKEKLHKPRLSMNVERLDIKNDQLLNLLEHIDNNVEISTTSLQNALLNQAVLINSIDCKHEDLNNQLRADVNKNMCDILRGIQCLNASFTNSLENIHKKMDLIMEKLSEFDVEEEADDIQNEIEEVPKDWISDDDMDVNNLENNNEDMDVTNDTLKEDRDLHDEKMSNFSAVEEEDIESDGD